MRLFLVFLFALAIATVSRAADVEFTRVWPGWRNAGTFERISEFFTGKEPANGQTILRTHADVRAGYYFLTRVKNAGAAIPDAKFSLRIIAPNNPETKTYVFPATLKAGASVFNLGLTGVDWTDPRNPPVAWKLELQRADGTVLASAQSFLWEKPAK
jgi:hypothetical protein